MTNPVTVTISEDEATLIALVRRIQQITGSAHIELHDVRIKPGSVLCSYSATIKIESAAVLKKL